MAKYDLGTLANQAVEDALNLLPPFDRLMKLSTHDFMKAIILAAAPTLEEAFRRWIMEELAEAGFTIEPEALKLYVAAQRYGTDHA